MPNFSYRRTLSYLQTLLLAHPENADQEGRLSFSLFFFSLSNSFNYYFCLGLFAPYLERRCLLPSTPAVSSAPRTMW